MNLGKKTAIVRLCDNTFFVAHPMINIRGLVIVNTVKGRRCEVLVDFFLFPGKWFRASEKPVAVPLRPDACVCESLRGSAASFQLLNRHGSLPVGVRNATSANS